MSNDKDKKTLGLKAGDRVRRNDGSSCLGSVKTLREEVIGSSGSAGQTDFLIQVQWDNGSLSYLAPESLERVSE